MNFAEKSRYDIILQQVTHKGRYSEMNYIKILLNAQALSVSVGKNYTEEQLMHIFLDNFHQGGNYSTGIASHQAELRREKKLLTKNIYLFNIYRLTIKILTMVQVLVKIVRELILSRKH